MTTDPRVNELEFKVQGLEQDIRELQRLMNQLLGHDKKTPADSSDTPVPQRKTSAF